MLIMYSTSEILNYVLPDSSALQLRQFANI